MKREIAIIGAGASGMVCAIVAGSNPDNRITIFDKNSKAGRKITITGNGRCNLTNRIVEVAHYHGHHPAFVSYALKQFGSKEAVSFFANLGLESVVHEDGRIFPMSLQASSVTAFLQEACEKVGVMWQLNSQVQKIAKEGGRFVLYTAQGAQRFDAVVIATGSAAMPTLGSSDSGYRFARMLGHRVFNPFAALVQLQSSDPLCAKASGVKIDALLGIKVDREIRQSGRGDLLFTNYGLSGLAILDLSRTASAALHRGERVTVMIDMLPDISLSALKKMLQKKATQFVDTPPAHWLNGILHQKLVSMLLQKTNTTHKSVLTTKEVQQLAYTIKHFDVRIEATRGVKGAEVMAGGVDTSQIDPKTMMSRIHKGLYFTGEVVDIDGDRGGYNLHWAWASGYLAGKHLAV